MLHCSQYYGRKEGEIFDAKFENEILPSRIEFWKNVSVMKVMPIVSFFLELSKHVASSFPVVFGNSGGNKPHSQAYRDFPSKIWGFLGTLYQIAGREN